MMKNEDLESSKFYSYKFHNSSVMLILPAFILLCVLFVSSFFVVKENIVHSMGMIVPTAAISPKTIKNHREGQELDNIKVVTYVPASEISLISKNQKMRIQFESRQVGLMTLSGYIENVGIYPVKQKNIYSYKVAGVVIPSKQELRFLRYGMQGKISIITDKASYFNYFKSKILNYK